MGEKAVVIHAMVFRRDKSEDPYPATIAGFMYDPDLSVGGGPILPPDEKPEHPIPPDLGIWPNPPEGTAPIPEHPIVLPDPPVPPENPPTKPEPPHQGWNWSAAKSGWYFLYVPGAGDAQPKRRR